MPRRADGWWSGLSLDGAFKDSQVFVRNRSNALSVFSLT